jgi:hypothetical protein
LYDLRVKSGTSGLQFDAMRFWNTLSKRTKTIGAVVLFPIPYLSLASLICTSWHTQLPKGAKSGAWFDLCMPDGLFFNFGLVFLVFLALVLVVPFIISVTKDYRASKP